MVSRARVRRAGASLSTSTNVDKAKGEIADTIKEMRKRYGEGTVALGREIYQPERISTGIFTMDFNLLGGIPANRASMVVGERHAGKSTLANLIVANSQRKFEGQLPVYVDVEGTFDATWAEKLGVDLNNLYVFQPETGESAVDAADALVRTAEVSLVVIDSIAALTPMKEIESSAEDALVGVQAKLVSSMIRKTNAGMISERNRGHAVTLFFLNQFRAKIGGFAKFGEPKSIPGGRALEFATSVQIEIKNKENTGKDENENESVTENEHSFKITKNKLNGGGRTGEFRLVREYDEKYDLAEGRINDAGTMLSVAKKFGAWSGGGSSWTLEFWDEERKMRGSDAAIIELYQDDDLRAKFRDYLIWEQAKHLNMPREFLARFTEPYGIEE
jgi:recombination protein RecA